MSMKSELATRPAAIWIGVSALMLPFAIGFGSTLVSARFYPSTVLFVAFVFLPFAFIIYRLWMQDRAARLVMTPIALCALGFALYAAFWSFTFEVPEEIQEQAASESANLGAVATVRMAEGTQRTGFTSAAVAFSLTVGLVAIYLPSSNRWFRRDDSGEIAART